MKKRVNFTKKNHKEARDIENTSKPTDSKFKALNLTNKLSPLEIEEEKVRKENWDYEFDMLSDLKSSEDRFNLNEILKNTDKLFQSPVDQVRLSQNLRTFKVKQATNKAIKRRRKKSTNSILEIVSEQRESEDETRRKLKSREFEIMKRRMQDSFE